VEPFFGGGAMMIHMYENNLNIKRFVLNDVNPEIVGLYRAIKSHVAEFIRIVDSYADPYLKMTKADRKTFYYETRKKYSTDYHGWGTTEESAVLYFLMKTAFNGIWQTTKEAKGRFCTPCGLLNQTGSVYDKDNVMEWNRFLQRVDIYSGDWTACVDEIGERALYFFDPPYRDSFTQYGQTFGDDCHKDLIDFCKKADAAGHLVMYCNRDADDDFYTKNQGQLSIDYYDIKYTAGRRSTDEAGARQAKAAREILLYSPAIDAMNCRIVPAVTTPKKKTVVQLNPTLFETV
jgi:DNA adenine methylase